MYVTLVKTRSLELAIITSLYHEQQNKETNSRKRVSGFQNVLFIDDVTYDYIQTALC